MAVERGLAPLHLGLDRHSIKVHILLEFGHLPRTRPLAEMRMKLVEQVSDREEPLKLDGACQNGMIERDAEASVRRAYDDQGTPLFVGDGVVRPRETDGAQVLREVVMNLVIARV